MSRASNGVVAFAIMVGTGGTFFAPQRAYADSPSPGPSASERACPGSMAFASTNGSDYIVAFGAAKPVTATFTVRMFADGNDYTTTLPAVRLATPYARGDGTWYRSTAIDLQKNTGKEPRAAIIDITTADGATCPPSHVFVPSTKAFKNRAPSPGDDALYAAYAMEVGDGTNATPLVVGPATAFPCKSPFTDARAIDPAAPDYPTLAKEEGVGGRQSVVIVTLDSASNVSDARVYRSSGVPVFDAATLVAAKKSTYASAVFACTPISGSYLFKADFAHT